MLSLARTLNSSAEAVKDDELEDDELEELGSKKVVIYIQFERWKVYTVLCVFICFDVIDVRPGPRSRGR